MAALFLYFSPSMTSILSAFDGGKSVGDDKLVLFLNNFSAAACIFTQTPSMELVTRQG